MLASSVLRNATRPTLRLLPKLQRRPLPAAYNTSTKLFDPSISALGYQGDELTEQEVGVGVQGNAPVKPPGADFGRAAMPLSSNVYPLLTPTLNKFTLRDKVAVVTGAGRGLGLNMAQALAESGVRGLAILDVQQDIGDQSARELSRQTGIDACFYRVDVRDEDEIHETVQSIADRFGRIDILINAAGIADSNIKAETYPLPAFRRLLDINITGTFITAQACAAHMISSRRGGSIINIASMSGSIVNFPQSQCSYNASKAGVIQLTKSLAAEWAEHGIRVNSISPGYMDTALNRVPALEAQKKIWVELTPQKRLGGVDDLNCLAVFLAGEGSGFMTGADCRIDGGYTVW
ncbi:uncharacterized protein LTR77_011131 [Saxophila tyrrhenica]|uniref:NADP-dependent mannitol dehydrogenase n=1 Tax=Saxophila tyrrhenica TaxID=1690608 RepID=A0AAV9NX32_9PEZI|nr:hypothetical protein LTR77_011131 [Saxophila tyrrhenica]